MVFSSDRVICYFFEVRRSDALLDHVGAAQSRGKEITPRGWLV